MVEVPAWALGAAGMFATCLLAVLGYLLRSMLSSIQKQGEQMAAAIKVQGDEFRRVLNDIRAELSDVDKRFLKEQLAQGSRFVDRESWTRDYVTLTQRIDGLHKRVDRVERDMLAVQAGRPLRPRKDSGTFEPPKG